MQAFQQLDTISELLMIIGFNKLSLVYKVSEVQVCSSEAR